jgi:hypothetical protein
MTYTTLAARLLPVDLGVVVALMPLKKAFAPTTTPRSRR